MLHVCFIPVRKFWFLTTQKSQINRWKKTLNIDLQKDWTGYCFSTDRVIAAAEIKS